PCPPVPLMLLPKGRLIVLGTPIHSAPASFQSIRLASAAMMPVMSPGESIDFVLASSAGLVLRIATAAALLSQESAGCAGTAAAVGLAEPSGITTMSPGKIRLALGRFPRKASLASYL